LRWDFGASAVPTTDTLAEVKGVRFSAAGEYDVKLSAVNSLGCRDSFIGKVIVYPTPSISSVTGDTVCIGAAPNLKVTGNEVLRYEWYSSPVGGRLLGTGANWRGPAIYDTDTFYVDAVGVGGCRLANRIGVAGYVKNNQQLNIPLIATELSNFPQPTVAFSAGAGFVAQTYEWDFGDGNFSNLPAPIHSYSNGGNYTIRLQGLDLQGCEYKIIAEQLVQLRDPRLFIFPNAFSPNNDGNNDEWKWIAPPVLSDFTLNVWSRTGNLVYTTTNPTDAWDGTYQATAVSEGVYVWKLTATFPDGQTVLRNGTITVIR
jgi:gliding motility-associated-like protein